MGLLFFTLSCICRLSIKKYMCGCVVTWNKWVYSNQGRGRGSNLQLVKQSIIMFIQHLCTDTGLWINAGGVSLTATSVATTGIKFSSTANRRVPNSGLCKLRPQDRRRSEFLFRIQDVWRSNVDPEPPAVVAGPSPILLSYFQQISQIRTGPLSSTCMNLKFTEIPSCNGIQLDSLTSWLKKKICKFIRK